MTYVLSPQEFFFKKTYKQVRLYAKEQKDTNLIKHASVEKPLRNTSVSQDVPRQGTYTKEFLGETKVWDAEM